MHTLIETYVTLALFQQTHYNKWIWQITVVSDIMSVAAGAEAEKYGWVCFYVAGRILDVSSYCFQWLWIHVKCA